MKLWNKKILLKNKNNEYNQIKNTLFKLKKYIFPMKNTPKDIKKLIYRSYLLLFFQKPLFMSLPLTLKYGFNSLNQTGNFYTPFVYFSIYSIINFSQTYLEGQKTIVNTKIAQNAWFKISLKAFTKLLEENILINNQNNIFNFEKGKNALYNNLYITLNNFIPIFIDFFITSTLLFYFCGYKYFFILLSSYYFYFKVTKNSIKLRLQFLKKINKLNSESNFIINESIKNNELVKSLDTKNHEFLKYKDKLNKSYYYNIKNKILLAKINFTQKSVTNISLCITLLLSSYECFKGILTPGDVLMIQTFMLQSFNPLLNLGNLIKIFEENWYELKDLISILNKSDEINNKENTSDFKFKIGEIEFKNINLNFNNKNVFKNFSLKIKGGQTILLTGESGKGKTSIFNLILGLIKPNEGEILIDKQNINYLTLDTLRKEISISYQQNLIFNNTILNNLRYGNINKYFKYNYKENKIIPKNKEIEKEIIDLCKEFNLINMVNKLDNKYQYILGNEGCKISTGEKQRISLVRSLLKNSNILLFDEPTTGLDAFNYQKFVKKIEKLKSSKKTIIIISHDLDLNKISDKVICLKNKGNYEYGTHNELWNMKSFYYNLYNLYLKNKLNR